MMPSGARQLIMIGELTQQRAEGSPRNSWRRNWRLNCIDTLPSSRSISARRSRQKLIAGLALAWSQG